MLYFYVNQSKNVGKVGKIMFDFIGKCGYNGIHIAEIWFRWRNR